MIGVLLCAYNVEPYIDKVLQPFLSRDDCQISAVSVPFEEYKYQPSYCDNTIKILEGYNIDTVKEPEFVKEHVARNLALEKIKDCDYIWLLDGDEIYTTDQIDAIISFIGKYYDYAWYRLSFKNYVFDNKTYLKEPFTPPRIFRNNYEGNFNLQFYWDNDIQYQSLWQEKVDYKSLPSLTVPHDYVWIDHYSWLNDEIGKRKVAYQNQHFGHCSFKWSESAGLEFNEEYFNDKEKPEVINE